MRLSPTCAHCWHRFAPKWGCILTRLNGCGVRITSSGLSPSVVWCRQTGAASHERNTLTQRREDAKKRKGDFLYAISRLCVSASGILGSGGVACHHEAERLYIGVGAVENADDAPLVH